MNLYRLYGRSMPNRSRQNKEHFVDQFRSTLECNTCSVSCMYCHQNTQRTQPSTWLLKPLHDCSVLSRVRIILTKFNCCLFAGMVSLFGLSTFSQNYSWFVAAVSSSKHIKYLYLYTTFLKHGVSALSTTCGPPRASPERKRRKFALPWCGNDLWAHPNHGNIPFHVPLLRTVLPWWVGRHLSKAPGRFLQKSTPGQRDGFDMFCFVVGLLGTELCIYP